MARAKKIVLPPEDEKMLVSAIHQTWNAIYPDALEFCTGRSANEIAIEFCTDANRMAMFANEEADKKFMELCKEHNYSDLKKHFSKLCQLV